MYLAVLSLHNLVRWVVLFLLLAAAVNAFVGWFAKRQWAERDRKVGSFAAMALDVQLLLGLLLYFVTGSPWTQPILRGDFATTMQGEYRFFSIEHVLVMVAAVVFAHLGSVLPKKASHSAAKYRRAALWLTLAVLLVVGGIPWARPLFRMGM